jgi:hypothetical protein
MLTNIMFYMENDVELLLNQINHQYYLTSYLWKP